MYSRSHSGHKKRKAESSLDQHQTLYHSFAAAANALSSLYAQAAQQHDVVRQAGAQAALVGQASVQQIKSFKW